MKLVDELKNKKYQKVLNTNDIKERRILTTFSGSIAYGLNDENSDVDIRGIFYTSPYDLMMYGGSSESINNIRNNYSFYADDIDISFYNLHKIIVCLEKGSPNIVELFGISNPDHIIIEDKFYKYYKELRNLIYNNQTINGYMGMVRNDISSLNKCNLLYHTSDDKSERKLNKLVCNIFRCLITMKSMIMEEEFSIKLEDYHIEHLLDIKKGNKYKLNDGSIYMPELLDDVSKYIYDIEVLKHNMSIPDHFDSKKAFELILDFYKSTMK